MLAVPDLDKLATVEDADMERMMRVSEEMLDCEVDQGDLGDNAYRACWL